MNIKIAKFKNGAKGAFSFVFDDGCYLPSTKKVVEIFKDIEKAHGVKLIATSAQTVSFLKEENIVFWKEVFIQNTALLHSPVSFRTGISIRWRN